MRTYEKQKQEEEEIILKDMDNKLSSLKEVSLSINKELKEQNGELNQFDNELDTTQANMNVALSRIGRIGKPGNKRLQQCGIIVLILMIIILLLLIITNP